MKAELDKADRAGEKLAMLYDGTAPGNAGVSKYSVNVGAECASREQAIWVNGRLIGRRIEICRDKKCATHGQNAPVPAKVAGNKGSVTPKLSAAEKAKAEAQKAEREKLLRKVETEKAYRERLWKELAAAEVPDAAGLQIARLACAHLATQGGGLIARILGLPDDAFEYGKRSEAVSRVAAMPHKNVVRAAALALVVTDLGVSEWSVTKGQKPVEMEKLAALLGLDVAAIKAGRPVKTASKPVAKPAAKPAKKALDSKAKKQIAAGVKKAGTPPKKKAAKKAVKK